MCRREQSELCDHTIIIPEFSPSPQVPYTQQEALAEARKNEAKRIQTLAKQAENSATRLRKYLVAQMIRSDVKKIEGVTVKIGLRKKQSSVLINVPAEELPADYVKVTHKPDLTKIRALLKSDAEIDWASLSESQDYSVTIR